MENLIKKSAQERNRDAQKKYYHEHPNGKKMAKRYSTKAHREAAALCRKLANNTCARCGKSTGRITAHHIIPLSWNIPGFEHNDQSNMVCLCQSCHAKLDNTLKKFIVNKTINDVREFTDKFIIE